MEYYDHMGFFGMHLFWWIFWVALFAGGFSFFEPVRRPKVKGHKQNHL